MKYFFVGIKGVGVINIATLYKEWGNEVLGSDTEEYFFTDEILKRLGISVVSFDEAHITSDIHMVIRSSAYGDDHPQIKRARSLNIPVETYSEALARIFNEHEGILVTGTHGKTTSAAMLARVLEDADFDPTVVVGGSLVEWGMTARAGQSHWMVAEGDEYQGKILALKPKVILLTNIEFDHPDFYPTEEAYRNTFRSLLKGLVEDALVVAHEDLREFVLSETRARTIFFGTDESLKLSVWGRHNQTNASGVLAVAREIGVNEEGARKTLLGFRGTKRRMELYTPADAPIVLVDDYAHHPTEIRATLRALREQYPKRRLIALFQAHTYSRTKALLTDFAVAFHDADEVIITDIYASAREKEKTITGEEFFDTVRAVHQKAHFAKTLDDAFDLARELCVENSVLVTLGAGDVWHVVERFSTQVE